jgi:hypothetical protein
MREIRTKIDIKASPEEVWNVLMDFDAYPEWNPFVVSIDGSGIEGEKLVAELQLEGKKPMKITPTVQENDAPNRFSWLGSMGSAVVFAGRHQFELEATDEGTTFHHREEFSGALAPMVLRMIQKPTTRGFDKMNRALRSRVENGA